MRTKHHYFVSGSLQSDESTESRAITLNIIELALRPYIDSWPVFIFEVDRELRKERGRSSDLKTFDEIAFV